MVGMLVYLAIVPYAGIPCRVGLGDGHFQRAINTHQRIKNGRDITLLRFRQIAARGARIRGDFVLFIQILRNSQHFGCRQPQCLTGFFLQGRKAVWQRRRCFLELAFCRGDLCRTTGNLRGKGGNKRFIDAEAV